MLLEGEWRGESRDVNRCQSESLCSTYVSVILPWTRRAVLFGGGVGIETLHGMLPMYR